MGLVSLQDIFGRREIVQMTVPVHQIIFSAQPDVAPPARAEEIRLGAGGPYRLWRLPEARELIGDVYGSTVLDALDRLRPFAYKADLARYCVVHHLGGLYVDLSVSGFRGFDVADYGFIGFRDPNSADTSWKVGNHMFFAAAGSPILEACIADCVEHVQQRFYGKDPHYPTGPSVLGRALANHSLDVKVLIGDLWWLKGRRAKYTLPGQPGFLARGKVSGRGLGGVSGVPGGNDYNALWRDRDVYG
jgi:hypothetical protein